MANTSVSHVLSGSSKLCCTYSRFSFLTIRPRDALCSRAITKGFGPAKREKPERSVESRDPNGVSDKVLNNILRRAAPIRQPERRDVRPIDSQEAARGKLDIVTVKNWGSGDVNRLGDLQVSDLQEGLYQEGSGEGTRAPDGRGPTSFFAKLAKELQLAEARGSAALSGPPPPPFQRWSFSQARYMQYMSDCLAVHQALEQALQAAAGAAAAAGAGCTGSSTHQDKQQQQHPAPQHQPPHQQQQVHDEALIQDHSGLHRAVLLMHEGLIPLSRSGAILGDMQALSSHPDVPGSAAGHEAGSMPQSSSSGSAAAAAGGGRSGSRKAGSKQHQAPAPAGSTPAAGQMARAYAQHLGRLAASYCSAAAAAAAAAAPGTSGTQPTRGSSRLGSLEAQEVEDGLVAGARLLAHAYVLHVVHLASGTRFGAAAAEKLQLLPRQAAAFYHSYGEGVQDPQQHLAAVMEQVGAALLQSPPAPATPEAAAAGPPGDSSIPAGAAPPNSRQDVIPVRAGAAAACRQAVSAMISELSPALQKTALLMSALAHED
mmetsp:Transcript_4578/g.9869  ORF Transcript_4578/g.9869 Transcript_4578/m.9869 type:complete len:543 (-) Transcript_4578:476-2104(-)